MERPFENDWAYFKSAVEDLNDFVLAPQDSWALSGSVRHSDAREVTRLTLGNVMLAYKRLQGRALSGDRQAEFQSAAEQLEQVRSRWRANWGRKAYKEFQNRLKLWTNAVGELAEDPDRYGPGYGYDVRSRAILELLKDETDQIDAAELTMVEQIDRRLRAITKPGPFVWEPETESAFPADTYWFLYRSV